MFLRCSSVSLRKLENEFVWFKSLHKEYMFDYLYFSGRTFSVLVKIRRSIVLQKFDFYRKYSLFRIRGVQAYLHLSICIISVSVTLPGVVIRLWAFHAMICVFWKEVTSTVKELLLFGSCLFIVVLLQQVLHPQSMRPAREGDIPVRVKNSYNPKAPGTLIAKGRDMDKVCT